MTTKLSDMMAGLSEEDLKDVRKRSRAHLKAMEDARRLDEIRRAANKKQGDITMAMGPSRSSCMRRPIFLARMNAAGKVGYSRETLPSPTRPCRPAAQAQGRDQKETSMIYDSRMIGRDSKFISLEQDHEVRDWAKTLGCSRDQLRAAVKAVGNSAVAVRKYLSILGLHK